MRAARNDDDAGFTLVEVVAALAVMAVVATASLYFFVGGARSVAHQSRAQSAVTVTSQAMELAYSTSAKDINAAINDGTKVSGLLKGRTQAAVTSAWSTAAALNVEGLADTYPGWEPGAAAGATLAVPIIRATELDGVTYASTILVGACYRLSGSTSSQDCIKVAGQATDPGAAPAGYVKLMRVLVVTTWPDTAGTCSSGTCSYSAQSLIDPNNDVVWNNVTRPVAMDDQSETPVGTPVAIPVLVNDAIGSVDTNPVVYLTMAVGSATLAVAPNGVVTFTPTGTASGLMQFTYKLRDRAGRISNMATVSVKVTGIAKPDSATVVKAKQVLIPVTANDLGSPKSVAVTPGSVTCGSAAPQGTSVLFTAPATIPAAPCTFSYSFTDASGLVSTTAVVTVTVTAWAPALTPDLLITIPASSTSVVVPFDMSTKTANQAGVGYVYRVESSGAITGEKLLVGSSAYNASSNKQGSDFGFAQQANTLGGGSFVYRAATPDGSWSTTTGTVRIAVVPVANDDTFSVVKNRNGGTTAYKLNVGANDLPNNFNGVVAFSATSANPPSCGSFSATQSDAQNGILSYIPPTSAQTCTFTYQFVGAAPYADATSNTATVTIKVTNW